jgi:peptidoglycan/xylan/chitin deacetylase (PgdA/CDA1 family)
LPISGLQDSGEHPSPVNVSLAAPNAAAARPTVVTLSFDDGLAEQYAVRSMLAQHSLRATFFVNSNRIESGDSYLTWGQLSDLAADGHEIGGHTLDHVDLTTVTVTRASTRSFRGADTTPPGGRGGCVPSARLHPTAASNL